jgi:hypothetical protein
MMAPAGSTLGECALRSAAGEPPLGAGGKFFRDDQAEVFDHPAASYRGAASRIAVLELEDGRWLSSPPSLSVVRPAFATREAALRGAIARMIRRARKYMRNRDGEGTQWDEGYAGRIIEWALSLKPETVSAMDARVEPGHDGAGAEIEGNQQVIAAAQALPAVSDDGGNRPVASVDPIVAALVAAHSARRAWPADHTVTMTNPVVNGQRMTVGTCSCGHIISYRWGDYAKMDAAVEAHWQKFDHLSGKVDGRGELISAEDGAAASRMASPQRKRRASPRSGDVPDLANAALPGPASCHASCAEGAGPSSFASDEYLAGIMARSTPPPNLSPQGGGEREAAPIGAAAGDDGWLLRAAAALAWSDEDSMAAAEGVRRGAATELSPSYSANGGGGAA